MLFEPSCFIKFIEDHDVGVIEYTDNWTDGADVKYHFFNDDLVIDMQHCIHIEVAKHYLKKINAAFLINELENIDCPCSDK
ncbi:hypothetical protein [Flavobacterium lipolyticum]|uniref:Uncharacterized protein n=1 Tax=Flavobacterium lipolyticum TaxID=2893754 RepID=A0ABS8M2W2_9FLAO|nr:hypothetical protein [Flavobacterium sp. F-126]MCC9018677.1 hypothetical protein [Flavobacterium sp. F-126]